MGEVGGAVEAVGAGSGLFLGNGAASGRGGGLCREGLLGGAFKGLPEFWDAALGGVFSAALMGLPILLNLALPPQ